jgi:predicted ATPase
MRLDRVYIDGFKNLKGVDIDFDEERLATVVIGQNGAGKSNLIEAITDVFRFVDMNRGAPRFRYEIDYRIGDRKVRLSNREGRLNCHCGRRAPEPHRFREASERVLPTSYSAITRGSQRPKSLR